MTPNLVLAIVLLTYSSHIISGESTLTISPVLPDDAGRYSCEDGGFATEHKLFAFLFVLDDDPICKSNIRTDGFIGPNSCGITPDVVELSCSIKFYGKIPPQVTWKKAGENLTPRGNITSITSENNLTNVLKLAADLSLDNSSYSCQIAQSNGHQSLCEYGVISVIDIKKNNITVNKTVGDGVTCLSVQVGRNCSCICQRHIGHDNGIVYAADQNSVKFEQPGIYTCVFSCIINGVQCATSTTVVNVYEEEDARRLLYLTFLSLPVIVVGIIAWLVFQRQKRSRKKSEDSAGHLLENRDESHKINGVNSNQKASMNKGHLNPKPMLTIMAKENNPVYGLAILDDELFIATGWSPIIEVRKLNELSSCRQFNVKGLICPYDMVSCTSNKCLYISNYKNKDSLLKILKVNINGRILTKWSTKQKGVESLSVTNDNTLIFTSFEDEVPRIYEYSPKGKLKRSIKISTDTQIVRVLSVIKLSHDQFLMSYGSKKYKNVLHQVCLVKVDDNNIVNTVLKSFGGLSASPDHRLCVPMHIRKTGDGSIIVADRENSRVILLDADLKLQRVLLSGPCSKLRKPMSLCMDESRGQLFVADNEKVETERDWADGQILVFSKSES